MVSTYGKKISSFLDLYYTLENTIPFQRYMYGTRLSFCICLEIAKSQYLDSASSYEKLCTAIPKSFGSRTSIQNTLNQGLNNNFLVKAQSTEDKRVQNIKIDDKFLKYVNDWVKIHTGIFDPSDTLKKIKIN